jgi:hypothetical protein
MFREFRWHLVNLELLKILAKINSMMETKEKRKKRGVNELKREKIREFFSACGWRAGKVHHKAGVTLRDGKGRLVHLFSFADAWDLMEMMKELLMDEERIKKVRELL